MTKPKPTITPTREFNAAILDKIVAHAMPEDQREDEFTVSDLVGRGMTRASCIAWIESGIKANTLARRLGRSRHTGHKAWLYRVKEDAHK